MKLTQRMVKVLLMEKIMNGFNRKDWIKMLSKHRVTTFDLDEFSGKLTRRITPEINYDDIELELLDISDPADPEAQNYMHIPGAKRLLKLAREIINFCEAHRKEK